MRTRGQGLQCHLQCCRCGWGHQCPAKQWVQAGQSWGRPAAVGMADTCTQGNKAGNYSVKYCAWQWWKAELSLKHWFYSSCRERTALRVAGVRLSVLATLVAASGRKSARVTCGDRLYQVLLRQWRVRDVAVGRTLQLTWPRPEEGGSRECSRPHCLGNAQGGTAACTCWWPVPMLCLGHMCMEQLAWGRITDRTQTSVYDFTLSL